MVLNDHLKRLAEATDTVIRKKVNERRYDRRYREYVLSSLKHVNRALPGVLAPHALELDELFVDLFLVVHKTAHASSSVLAEVPAPIADRHTIHEFLDREAPSVLAVVGAPGSGKTTLLRHLARDAARSARRQQRAIPILLTLREHSDWIAQTSPVSLAGLLQTTLRDLGSAPDGWWEHQLRRGNCLVLLDGLDEVAVDQDLEGVIHWIEHQIEVYPHNDYVITSRPHGYQTAAIRAADVLQLQPFTDAQIERFVRGWCLAVERHAAGGDSSAVTLRAERRAADLLKRLTAAPQLYDLAVNPLLLTMIVNVHRHANALPRSRAELYRTIFQVTLRSPDADGESGGLDGSDKERVLAGLAFAMMKAQARELPQQQVLENIASGLKRSSATRSPRDFLADAERRGLLVETERGCYGFAHHTFGEYLAATHIRDNRHSRLLMKQVNNGWWRETTLLYVADADADPIIRACLRSHTITALALAFDCAQHSGALAPELRDRLEAVRAAAFHDGADPAHRRLVAGALALRHLHGAEVGYGVCPQPVAKDLYWLFLQDTRTPPPDGPTEFAADPTQPVAGVWGRDALTFVRWVNGVTADTGASGHRLPTHEEMRRLASEARPLMLPFHESATSVWTRTGNAAPALYVPPGIAHPHAVTGRQILDATVPDVADSAIIPRLELIDARGLVQILDHLLTLTFDRDLARAIEVALLAEADLPGEHADGVATPVALDTDLARQLSRDFVQDRDLARALDRARAQAVERAQAVGHEEHRLAHALGLDRDLLRALDPAELAYDLGRTRTAAMGLALGRAFQAAREQPVPGPRAEGFAGVLTRSAGISDGDQITVDLDALAHTARHTCATFLDRETGHASWAAVVAGRLGKACAPVFSRRRSLAREDQMVIRLPALALAADADNRELGDVGDGFRTIAAGVTLLQRRATGEAPLETIVLARA
ncbi:MAG: NACHT domain-containing protein [Micromonosporaceae bacterium]